MHQKSKKLTEAVKAFNKLYPIGTLMILVDDMGVEHKRKLVSEAWIIGNHSAIAKFEGLSGGYNINRVKQTLTNKTNDLGMSYLVPADANGAAL
jgi:hypothetical protein